MAIAKRAKEELASREAALRAQLSQERNLQLQVSLSLSRCITCLIQEPDLCAHLLYFWSGMFSPLSADPTEQASQGQVSA